MTLGTRYEMFFHVKIFKLLVLVLLFNPELKFNLLFDRSHSQLSGQIAQSVRHATSCDINFWYIFLAGSNSIPPCASFYKKFASYPLKLS